jgi:hypothetical protein
MRKADSAPRTADEDDGGPQTPRTADGRRRTQAERAMGFKFENLEVWQLSLDYVDLIYAIAAQPPRGEEYNLKS